MAVNHVWSVEATAAYHTESDDLDNVDDKVESGTDKHSATPKRSTNRFP
jgi:hypothetical protein